ncbi:hypothetical protein ACJIZ3_012531 [Penstemon smallii]|uniref:Transmembrane protein n=1 Tax=Penstemon smallii TaxID=265156 RepID=A0ABD3UMA9_9LAMI
MASSSALLSLHPLSIFLNPKSLHFKNSYTPLLATNSSIERSHFLNLSKPYKTWKLSANLGNYLISEAIPLETSQDIVSTTDNGVSNAISALLLIAFVGLTILTIGVIYIAVTDFLQKREREKFEKEEAAKKKKSGKKGKVRARARAGPKGFGQKIEEDDDFDETD